MTSFLKHFRLYFFVALVCAALLVWYAVFQAEHYAGKLVLQVFDVGQGDSVFIQAENGNRVLVDGGPTDAVLAKLGSVLPFWEKKIDVLILTHPHADHITGLLSVIERYDIGMVIESGVRYESPEYAQWHQVLEEKRIPVIIARQGQQIRLSPNARLEILTPFETFEGKTVSNVHDAMVAAKLEYGSTAALLMGDAERMLEYRMLFSDTLLDADILKAGHHGSDTSSTQEFLRVVTPEFAVISAGKNNRYGHPHPAVIERMGAIRATILRTDEKGDIGFTNDGTEFIREKPW